MAAVLDPKTTSFDELSEVIRELDYYDTSKGEERVNLAASLGLATDKPKVFRELAIRVLRIWTVHAKTNKPEKLHTERLLTTYRDRQDGFLAGFGATAEEREAGAELFQVLTDGQLLTPNGNFHSAFLNSIRVFHSTRQALADYSGQSAGQALSTIDKPDHAAALNAVKRLYLGNEAEVLQWATAPGTSRETLKSFLKVVGATEITNGVLKPGRFHLACRGLEPIRQVRLFMATSDFGKIRTWVMTRTILKKSLDVQAALWVQNAKTMTQLFDNIQADVKKYHLDVNVMALAIAKQLQTRPDLITSQQDFRILYENEFFWSETLSDSESSPLEKPLMELLKSRREKFGNNSAWKYDPILAEKMHQSAEDRLVALRLYPTTYNDLLEHWKLLTSRGVSTVSDALLGRLLKVSNSTQMSELEKYAVLEGRVFDQGLRDEFALRQIHASPQYLALMEKKDAVGTDRKQLIKDVIAVAQRLLSDLGIFYRNFMETMSED
ncbi:MAG: hypothetical protein K2X47_12930, partial [Bdellovibrionales bacterium]|nr:hypothetical protein [Bdellovibrionales bacterium]